jgi:hypothetical protein
VKLPHFIPGTHYIRQPSCGWEYTLLRDVHIPVNYLPLPNVLFRDAAGRSWVRIVDGVLIISKGYSWNGNSFAVDTRKNMLGSLVHDALYQFSAAPGFPMTREQADLIYLGILRGSGFMFAGMYYCAVKRFGGVFWESNMGETMETL